MNKQYKFYNNTLLTAMCNKNVYIAKRSKREPKQETKVVVAYGCRKFLVALTEMTGDCGVKIIMFFFFLVEQDDC